MLTSHVVGRKMGYNPLTALPSGLFANMTQLLVLFVAVTDQCTAAWHSAAGRSLCNTRITVLPAGIFDDLVSLQDLYAFL